MSSDHELERLLRDAQRTLPEPDEEATRGARERALAAAGRRRPRRLRAVAVAGAMLVVAVALGAGVAFVAPTGTASRGPVGLGFVPEPGWFAFQTGGQNGDVFQTVAVASNVPLAQEDQVAGAADPSGLPYATLLSLPREGIVIVATFTRPNEPPFYLQAEPELELPLGIRDATPLQYGTQLRPEDPLGQYEIRGLIKRHHVNVYVYFGSPKPSGGQLAEADRQLAEIVVRRTSGRATGDATPTKPTAATIGSAQSVIDRTVTCAPALIGGVRQIDTLARAGSGKQGSSWNSPALAAARTTVSGAAATAVDDNLVWVAAGSPSASSTVVSTVAGITFPMRSWGTLAVNRRLCRTTPQKIPLSRRGVSGGPVGPFDDRWDCATGRRVVVRVRAVVRSKTELGSYRGFLRTTVPVKSATIVVATPAGRTLSYAEVSESGKSRLFVAPSCLPD